MKSEALHERSKAKSYMICEQQVVQVQNSSIGINVESEGEKSKEKECYW